ncbi:MAG: AEC family transporter [Aggregatilineales bacterium]
MVGELLQIFANNIAPILLIAGIGYFSGRRLRVDPAPLGRIIFYLLSPALIFRSLSTSEIVFAELVKLILVMALFVTVMAAVGLLAAGWRTDNRVSRASVVLAAICPNNGNYGLPVISFAFGPSVLARAVVIFVATTLFNYTLGVFVASRGQHTLRESLAVVARVPVLYAAVFSLFVNFADIVLPPFIERPVLLLSQATIPLMLILLGLQLAQTPRVTQPELVGIGVGLRLLLSPLVSTALVLLLGLDAPAAIAIIMQASMPVAVVTIILATEFELNRQLSLSMILASTLISPITLSLLILVLSRLEPSLAG